MKSSLSVSLLLTLTLTSIQSSTSNPIPSPQSQSQSQSQIQTQTQSIITQSFSPSSISSHSLLDTLGRFFSAFLNRPHRDNSTGRSRTGRQDGNRFPIDSDGSPFDFDMGQEWAWGSTTLEVVKTSAIYLTRPAAFGPRITSEEGLKGTLLPISDFYRPTSSSSSSSEASEIYSIKGQEDLSSNSIWDDLTINKGLDNHGCPLPNGPGWKEDSDSDWDWNSDPEEGDSDLILETSSPFHDQKFHQNSNLKKAVFKLSHQNYTIDKPPSDFIALIERGGNCSFVEKVRLSQALGAIAVVIGDESDLEGNDGGKEGREDLGKSGRRPVTMFGKDSGDITIPSGFVTRGSYLDLLRLIEEIQEDEIVHSKEVQEKGRFINSMSKDSNKESNNHKGLEIVLSRTDLNWEWPLIDLALLLLLLPSLMTILTIIIHRIKVIRQRRKDRAPKLAVLNLPCLIWRSDGRPWEKVDGDDEEGENQDLENQTTEDNQDPGPSNRRNLKIKNPLKFSSSSSLLKKPNLANVEGINKASFGNECAICLDEFQDGDRIRLLPCGHIYHKVEIDDWLCRIKKLCPICKRDVTVPIPPAPPVELQSPTSEEEPAANGNTTNEATPLLNNADYN